MQGIVYNQAYAVTKSDTDSYPWLSSKGPSHALYVGTKGSTGTIVVVQANGVTATYVGVNAGTILPIQSIRINNTTTDASDILALYQV